MKKTDFLSHLLLKELARDKHKYILVICLFIVGILSGTLTASLSNNANEIQQEIDIFLSSYSLQGTIKSHVFVISALNYVKFAFFLWASGWYTWLFPLCFLQVFFKGFRTGYTIACFLQCYHFRGIILSILTILPQNLLFLPAMFFFSVYQFQFLSDRRFILMGKSVGNFKKQIYCKNLIYLLIFLCLLLICAVIEGYLTSSFLQPVSKYLF